MTELLPEGCFIEFSAKATRVTSVTYTLATGLLMTTDASAAVDAADADGNANGTDDKTSVMAINKLIIFLKDLIITPPNKNAQDNPTLQL